MTAGTKRFGIEWLLLIGLGITWGGSYFLMKKGLVALTPIQMASLRNFVAFIAFLPFIFQHFKKVKKENWKHLAVVGFCGSFIPSFCYAFAQTEISSSVTGILSSLQPLTVLIVSITFYGAVLKRNKLLGVLIGLVGALAILWFGRTTGTDFNVWYAGLILLALFCYAFSMNTLKRYLQNENPLLISAIAFLWIGIPSGVILGLTDLPTTLTQHPHGWTSLGYVVVLALLGTFAASIFFFRLVQLTSPVFASTVGYLIPVVALLIGALDGELITFYHLVGMVLILYGVYLVKK